MTDEQQTGLPLEPTLREQIHCVARELRMRQRTYPRWIAKGMISAEEAEREQRCMRAVLVTLYQTEARILKAEKEAARQEKPL